MALVVRRASYERRHGGRLTIGWVGVIRLVNGYRVGQPETATAATQTRVQTATMSYQATARSSGSQLPLEELNQLASVFSMVKNTYVDPVDNMKLIQAATDSLRQGVSTQPTLPLLTMPLD